VHTFTGEAPTFYLKVFALPLLLRDNNMFVCKYPIFCFAGAATARLTQQLTSGDG